MQIKGLGPASIKKLGLTHPIDLYQEQDWDELGANGIKIQEEIERTKTKPYQTVLAALVLKVLKRRSKIDCSTHTSIS